MRKTDELIDSDLHERGISAFIVETWRARCREQLANQKKRPAFLASLPHFAHWTEASVVHIAPNKQFPPTVVEQLRTLGASNSCWVISSEPSLDRKQMGLDIAVRDVLGLANGTIISCVPGRLAYFEGEGLGNRFILHVR